jgi:hypothetical protein
MDDRPHSSPPVLIREVNAPAYLQSGLGVLFIASMAMLFAVASAAFLVRARMDGPSCPHAELRGKQTAWQEPADARPSAPARTDCGEAVYHSQPDGSVIVTFDLCAPEAPATRQLEGVEVRAIHR